MQYVVIAMGYAVLGYSVYRLQRTIDRLTDKLMARDYKEYAVMNQSPPEAPKKTRKPLSWYDDADIDEEATN